MKFEVFIPGMSEDDFDITLKVKAKSWIDALKAGLVRMGEDASVVKHILIDIMDDNSIHVTDSVSNRVFRIRELDVTPEPVVEEITPEPVAEETTPEPVAEETTPEVLPLEDLITDRKIPPRQFYDPETEIEDEQTVKATQEIRLGRIEPVVDVDVDAILADLFTEISDVDDQNDLIQGMDIVIDLCMKYINCESGSTFLVDMDQNDIYFASIRGPKAEALKALNLRIPMGLGIVGLSVAENVSLAISDVNKDPRFYQQISEKLGYPTYSILCVPIHKDGRVYGAVELINKKGNNRFTPGEISVIDYISTHAAQYLERKVEVEIHNVEKPSFLQRIFGKFFSKK